MIRNPRKGDLVYLPSDITLLDTVEAGGPADWIRLSEPTTGLMIEPNINNENIYHRVHVRGNSWLVRTIDTLEVMSHV